MPTRFKGPLLGARHSGNREFFEDLPLGVDLDHLVVFDDFNQVAVDSTNDWTVVKDTNATVAIGADAAFGTLVLTSEATTDDDGASIQGNEIFLPAVGKKIWFEARFQGSTVADMEVFIGLSQNFATNPEAVKSASNFIGFVVADGSASLLCQSEVSDANTSTASGVTLADATYVTVGFVVDGTSSIKYFVNRELVATHTSVPTTELALAAFELSGSITGTRSMTIDYIFGAASRNAVDSWS